MRENLTRVEIDEALEVLWTLEERDCADEESLKKGFIDNFENSYGDLQRNRFRDRYRERVSEAIIESLLERKLAKNDDGNIKLTGEGNRKARGIVRRHRLAERLLTDLLDMGEENIERPACEFEHLLSKEATDRICTLLGHPAECPHGLPIPAGGCCKGGREDITPVIKPASKAALGEKMVITYIQTNNHPRLHRLLSYDIGPGSEIVVLQKNPVYVLKVGETDIAIEEDIVEDIYVRSSGD